MWEMWRHQGRKMQTKEVPGMRWSRNHAETGRGKIFRLRLRLQKIIPFKKAPASSPLQGPFYFSVPISFSNENHWPVTFWNLTATRWKIIDILPQIVRVNHLTSVDFPYTFLDLLNFQILSFIILIPSLFLRNILLTKNNKRSFM